MLVFIDDSGDAGFKIDKGSTEYFVIALVIFDDALEAEKTAVAIKELRRKLGFPENAEFRFFKSSHRVRKEFLEAIAHFQFRIRYLVVDKKIIYSNELRTHKESFYSYIIKMALKYTNGSIINARIKIDGSGNRIFRKKFLTYLRKELNTSDRKIIGHCRLVDSKDNVLIQMADMVAGTIRRYYDDKNSILKDIINEHIEDPWLFQ